MNREQLLERATKRTEQWDFIIIGGGATGAGIAVDAASRRFSVLLLERHDFSSGTSSRSTKLVHGGVRYLKQGHIPLVFEALRERSRLRRNAPHLVRDLPFVIPSYRWWETPYYGLGLSIYDLLAGGGNFGHARMISQRDAIRRVPTVRKQGLRGGIVYHDGQFDDSRLLIDLMQTAVNHGAVVLNYCPVIGLETNPGGRINGVHFRDQETNRDYQAAAQIVVNATGVFVDGIRQMAERNHTPLVAPSQGTHLVFDRRFLPGHSALMVPQTSDGRVMFAIPWLGHTLVGTTDVSVPSIESEPRATEQEIEFLLETAGRYLNPSPTRSDVLSVFTGIRPLVQQHPGMKTASLSREHVILEQPPGLLTITGGKWTTYRRMAEQLVDHAIKSASLPSRPCRTRSLRITNSAASLKHDDPPLHPQLYYTSADVVQAVRNEMARTVADVLARRTRALFLNARAAIDMAPTVAAIMAAEFGRDRNWQSDQVSPFVALADRYLISK